MSGSSQNKVNIETSITDIAKWDLMFANIKSWPFIIGFQMVIKVVEVQKVLIPSF